MYLHNKKNTYCVGTRSNRGTYNTIALPQLNNIFYRSLFKNNTFLRILPFYVTYVSTFS